MRNYKKIMNDHDYYYSLLIGFLQRTGEPVMSNSRSIDRI